MHHVKTSDTRLDVFLTGGAGTHVVNILVQCLRHYYNLRSGDPDASPLLLRAFNIQGDTIHGAIRIYAKQKLSWNSLSSDVFNTLRIQFKDLKLVKVDETSLISYELDKHMGKSRLREIMGVERFYGGLHLLRVGDLLQLRHLLMLGLSPLCSLGLSNASV